MLRDYIHNDGMSRGINNIEYPHLIFMIHGSSHASSYTFTLENDWNF